MRRGNALKHSGHADRVAAHGPEHADLRRGLVLRAVDADIYAVPQRHAAGGGCLVGQIPQGLGIGPAHVVKARADAVVVLAGQRALAGEIDVIVNDHEVTDREIQVDATRGIGQDDGLGAEQLKDRDRIGHLIRRIALVPVQTALHTQDGLFPELSHDQPAGVVRRGHAAKIRHLAEGDRERVFQFICERPKARSQDERGLGHPAAECAFEEICALLDVFIYIHSIPRPFPAAFLAPVL